MRGKKARVVLALTAAGLALGGAILWVAPTESVRAQSSGYTPGTVTNGGTIEGLAKLVGAAKAPAKIPVPEQFRAVCGATQTNNPVATGSGGALAGVVVSLDNIHAGKALDTTPVSLAQQGCTYTPRITSGTRGSKLTITNNDAILHNVHAYRGTDTAFNLAMPLRGQKLRRPLDRAGQIELRCDAGHTWMHGYIWVFDHPYHATTGATGRFRLTDVPAGQYTLVAWHETLGRQTSSVTVTAGGTAQAPVTFRPH